MRWAIILAFSLASAASAQPRAQDAAAPYAGCVVVRVQLNSPADALLMESLGADLWSHRIEAGEPADFMLTPGTWETLDRSGLEYRVVVPDVQGLVDAEASRIRRGGRRGWFDDFKPLSDINDRLDALAAGYPDLASEFTVGESVEGREVRALRLVNDAWGDPDCKPTILINACQHAREWISPMVAMYAVERLLAEHGVDPEVTALLDRVEIVLVPVVNVDGYEFTWTKQRLWRKNRRDNGDGTFGVDLNRNWGYEWGHDNGSSGKSNQPNYRGTSPFSEPETQMLRDLALSRPRLAAQVDLHSYGQLILAPWGYTIDLPPDHGTFQMLGADMQQDMLDVHGRLYEHGPEYTTLYPVSGGEGDWFWGDRGVHNFLIELRGNGFVLPPEEIIPNGEEAYPALLHFASWSRRQKAPAADFNDDASIDTRDVVVFLNAWAHGEPGADFDHDGAVDAEDVTLFLSTWVAGCS